MWYGPTRTRNTQQLGISSLAEPNEGNANRGEIFYSVKKYELEPNTNTILPLRDNGLFEGHVFAAFNSAGNQISRYPTVAQNVGGIQYISSYNNGGGRLNQNNDLRKQGAWSDNNFVVPVPADGLVFVHYILIDELSGSRGAFQYCAEDFSDAPASYGLARHQYDSALSIGTVKDVDRINASNATATGDDADGDGDSDEDGIATFAPLTTADTNYSVDVAVRNTGSTAATLYGWIDFNHDDVFSGASEFATVAVPVGATSVTLNWTGLSGLSAESTFARFRLTTDTLTNAQAATSAGDGEVEDHALTIQPAADLQTVKTLAPGSSATPAVGDNVSFLITVTNNGPENATNVMLTDNLPTGLSYDSDSATAGSYDDTTGVWTIGSLANTTSETLTLTGTVDASAAGQTMTNITTAATTLDQVDPGTTGDDLEEAVDVDNPIVAITETYQSVNGADGGTLPSILGSDTLNSQPVDQSNVTFTVDSVTGPDSNPTTAITVNSDGTVTVPPGTLAGSYEITYTICEVLNSSNCSSITETVTVTAPGIDAIGDDFSSTPVDGVSGSVTPSVFDNDTLNGASFDPSKVIFSITDVGGIAGLTTNPDGTLNVPAGTSAGVYAVTYEICETLNSTNCDSAIATVNVATVTTISGTVFTDENDDDNLQTGEPLVEGVEVRIVDENGAILATTTTDANGFYSFSGLTPGTYDILFFDTETGTAIGGIMELSAPAGETVVDQNLPIDPSGVIYDAATGDPIEGAIAVLTDVNGVPLPEVCFIDDSQQNQVTGASGFYRFDLVPDADPACPLTETEYLLDITLPGGVPTVFAFAPEAAPLDATTCTIDAQPGGDCQVFIDGGAPQPGTPSIFFTSFLLEAGDPNVINNHIPVNLSSSTQPLVATKTAATATAGTGAIVPYTITISNQQDVPVLDTDIVDDLPLGFRFVEGSSLVDGLGVTPTIEGNRLIWVDIDIPADSAVTIELAAVVGSGVSNGDFVNQAFAQTGLDGSALSNIATATVRIEPDEVFDCSEVIGKVFHDRNSDGYQDNGEPGLPGVRVATVQGLLITTDEYGRYHIACAATPREGIGSNFILKLDERTLPNGYGVGTENPRVVRLTEGKLTSVDFGVTAPRRVRLELTEDAFLPGVNEVSPDALQTLEQLIVVLQEQRSILVLSYSGENGAERMHTISAQIRSRWRKGKYRLSIETEIRSSTSGEDR